MKKNITADDLMFAVATFNADAFCVEDEDQAAEIMAEINENGIIEITDKEERETALAQLDLPEDSQRIVYRAGACTFSLDDDEYTYDVEFDDETSSNNEGWSNTFQQCKNWIEMYNGTNESYFEDYKGGTVSIVCNETGEFVYEEKVR